MSSSKRRSRFFGLFGRKEPSQSSITTLGTTEASATLGTAGASATLGTTGASTTASAGVADVSGWENSAAALRNLQNASEELDNYLRSEEGQDGSLANVFERSRWTSKVQAYPNSSFASCGLPEFPVDHDQRQLMRLAASSAIRAYRKPGADERLCDDFDVVGEALNIDPSHLVGSIKATTVELHAQKEGRCNSSKVLVVAIRGSATTHDWMVNLNDGADSLVEDLFMGVDDDGNLYTAHSGFLACAKAMNDTVLDNVHQLYSTHFGSRVASEPQPTLLFTGHSAGGAVAAMLYAHFVNSRVVSENRSQSVTLKSAFASVHCITFGAPPLTTRPFVSSDASSICLSVVNDGDPVARADAKYIPALLKIFSGPMPDSSRRYSLPSRTFFNAGQVIVVLPSGFLLKPNESGPGSLAETVMGDKRAHIMKEYWRRMQLLFL